MTSLERNASQIGGRLLILALYVVLQSLCGLLYRHTADASLPGLAIAAIAVLGMLALSQAKLRLTDEIGSATLRADAMESLP